RCVLSVHCVRLHRVKWTVRIHVVGEVVVAQHVASVRVNTEEWGLRTLWPHRYQGRGALRSALRLAPPTDAFGEQPDAREPEHVLDRDLTLELITQLAVQLNGQKRMASQIEEVVVATDMADPQQILPRSRDSLFDCSLRGGVIGPRVRLDLIGRRKRLAIHLLVRRERELREHDEVGGQHELGKALLQMLAQLRLDCPHTGPRHDVRHQPLISVPILACDNHDGAHRRMLAQGDLYLAEFDAMTADLHLMIDTSEKLECSVRAEPCDVSGPIQERTGSATELIREETLGRESGAAEVAARHSIAADVEFSGDSEGRAPQRRIEHVHLRVRDRPAYRNRILDA